MKLALLLLSLACWAQDQPATSGSPGCPLGSALKCADEAHLASLQAENALLRAQLDQLKQESAYAAQVCALPDLILARARTIQAQRAVDQAKQVAPAKEKQQ